MAIKQSIGIYFDMDQKDVCPIGSKRINLSKIKSIYVARATQIGEGIPEVDTRESFSPTDIGRLREVGPLYTINEVVVEREGQEKRVPYGETQVVIATNVPGLKDCGNSVTGDKERTLERGMYYALQAYAKEDYSAENGIVFAHNFRGSFFERMYMPKATLDNFLEGLRGFGLNPSLITQPHFAYTRASGNSKGFEYLWQGGSDWQKNYDKLVPNDKNMSAVQLALLGLTDEPINLLKGQVIKPNVQVMP